jgi:hypothetical protein
MATVLEKPKSSVLLCVFCGQKKLNAKDINKVSCLRREVFLSRKAVHNLVEKFSQGRSKVADDAEADAEVAETTVKRLLCCGFRRTGKAMGHVYQCWRRICREIIFFLSFEYHMF